MTDSSHETEGFLDLHLTNLSQWAMRQVGGALVIAAVVGGIVGVAGVANESPAMVAVGIALGILCGGLVLRTADAPLPPGSDDG